MKVTYYGHSCFEVEIAGKRLLFDPFITPNPLAADIDITQLKPDYIFLSHGHYDHVADVEAIARASDAVVVGCFEVIEWFKAKGLTKHHSMNIGGSWNFDFGQVIFTNAVHSSSMPDGSYGGQAGGFVIKSPEGSFYYSGDTAFTRDMELLKEEGPFAFAVLCLGDNFTMGVQGALKAAQWLECHEILGVHYDTFSPIKINNADAERLFQEAGKKLYLPAIGTLLSF